ncbi:hypothetical protein P5G50_18335 [Leifsonia sp. F6_8S_P_1B]|uniref:Tail terminator n=1 Tax=Leifsonia williamsii TaxID=3035919 RepID=A0ABT8KG17_9MICO|nr:hypothetical protein [Leifsonia williamsii]MDN4616410.1 hypothetical protein [Leifsonia williamsii]
MSGTISVIYEALTAPVIAKVKTILSERPEPFTTGAAVSNQVIAGKRRMVTIVPGPGLGAFDTLDDTTLRVNVYADDEGDCEDLAALIRAVFEATAPLGIIDGKPITASRVTAGPVPVPNDTTQFQQYMVVNVTRRGREFR